MTSELIAQLNFDPAVIGAVILLAPFLLCWLALGRFRSWLELALAAAVCGLYCVFAFFSSYWFVLSAYLQWCIPPLFLLASGLAIRRKRGAKREGRPSIWSAAGCICLALLAGSLGWLDYNILRGAAPNEPAVELTFPFREGSFVISQGGGTLWTNYHGGRYPHSAQAVDILRIDAWGRRANGPLPPDLKDYFIYGTPVTSPCSGKVIGLEDGVPNSPLFGSNPEHSGGNRVTLACGKVAVFLFHMIQGSLRVRLNQEVQVGDLIGLAGSSGNSSEPHLHIEARRYAGGSVQGDSLPITFQGRYPLRNSIFRAGE
jgi:hypothetical protein